MKEPKKTCRAMYDKSKKTLYIEAKEEQFVPAYLKYYIKYLELPEDTKIVYTLDEAFKK